MEPLDYAMEIEKEGQSVYKEFADQAPNKELKTVFQWLAESEARHYKFFADMKANQKPFLEESSLLEDSVNIFTQIKENKDPLSFKSNQGDVYQKVFEIEKKMADFYTEKAQETDDVETKKVFEKIALEEKRHQYLMENVIDFVRNPEVWLKEDKFKQILDGLPL